MFTKYKEIKLNDSIIGCISIIVVVVLLQRL
jgi:hypothetical protein